MKKTSYVVCSEYAEKPITRGVFDDRRMAEQTLERLRREDNLGGATYWIAEVGSECEGWRLLGVEPAGV